MGGWRHFLSLIGRNRETDSVCNILGEASGGPLAGEKFTHIIPTNHFRFSRGPIKTDTKIYEGAS